MKTKCFITAIGIIMMVCLSSCNTVKTMIAESTRAGLVELENKQKETENRHQREKTEAINAVIASKDLVIKKQENQLQESANSLYGADIAFKAYKEPTRLDLIINNRVTEATKAISKAPTFEAMQQENLRLIKEMDETKTSLADLKNEHQRVLKEKEQVAKEKINALESERKAKEEMNALNKKHQKETEDLNKDLNEKKDKIIEQQGEQLERKKQLDQIKTKISTICGIISLLCLVGAIYSPVFKSKFGLLSGILALCSIGIWFVEPWMVAVGFALVFVAALAFFAREHYIADTANDNMINAIQDHKESDDASSLKEHLKSWNTKYVKQGDSYREVSDKTIEQYINDKLKEYGRLDTNKKP